MSLACLMYWYKVKLIWRLQTEKLSWSILIVLNEIFSIFFNRTLCPCKMTINRKQTELCNWPKILIFVHKNLNLLFNVWLGYNVLTNIWQTIFSFLQQCKKDNYRVAFVVSLRVNLELSTNYLKIFVKDSVHRVFFLY